MKQEVQGTLETQGHTGSRGLFTPRFTRRAAPTRFARSSAVDAGSEGVLVAGALYSRVQEVAATEPIAQGELILPRPQGVRRVIDVFLAAGGLLLTSPLLIAAAIAIRLDSHGSPFFRQERIGRGGEPFSMLKLRTMIDAADQQKAAFVAQNCATGLFKIPGDPRITRVGRVLRKNHLDELPQLWNVLCGHMTIVGPRPLVASEHSQIPDSQRSVREYVRPGITGPWQILGPLDAGLDELAELDVEYVLAGPSARRDLGLVARTIGAVASGRGH